MMIWQIGEGFVVCLASLQGVSRGPARPGRRRRERPPGARSGASPCHCIAPALLLLLFRDTILSFQANFVPALIVGRGGGPDYATTFLPMYIYTTAFGYLRFGYAAAMTCAMYLITGLVLWLQYRTALRWHRGLADGCVTFPGTGGAEWSRLAHDVLATACRAPLSPAAALGAVRLAARFGGRRRAARLVGFRPRVVWTTTAPSSPWSTCDGSLANSLLVAALAVPITVVVASLAGFAMSQVSQRWRLRVIALRACA